MLLLAILAFLCAQDAGTLIQQLGARDIDLREEAARKLSELGDRALHELDRALKDRDPEVSGRAARVIREISIGRLLGSGFTRTRPGVAARLARGGAGVWRDLFLESIGEKDGARAREARAPDFLALMAVREIRPEELPAVLEKARDLNLVAFQPDVTRLLQSDDLDERSLVSLARLHLRDPEPAFLALLRSPLLEVRYPAALILETVEPADALPAFVALAKDRAAQVREISARALGRHPGPGATPALRDLLKDVTFFVRSEAAQSLGRLGVQEAIPEIRGLLKDPSAGVRRSSVRALGQLRAREAATELVGALSDESPAVRAASAGALAELGLGELRSKLSPLLEDPNLEVREAARRAWLKLEKGD